MFDKSKKKAGVTRPPPSLRNPQTLVVTLDPNIAAKYASIAYTPHGWVGVNRNTGGEELLPRSAFLLRPLSELIGDE